MKTYIAYFKDFGLSIYTFKGGFDLVLICITISVDFIKHADQGQTENSEA